jgi:DnaJ-class molecular chaperone
MGAVYDMKRMQIRFTYEDDDGEEIEAVLPGKVEVCGSCCGSGSTTSHVEPDGGGYTSSEWQEACHDDEDFAENYMSGAYDRDCEECRGLRVVLVVDEEHCDPALLEQFHGHLSFEAGCRREDTYCRRMGY